MFQKAYLFSFICLFLLPIYGHGQGFPESDEQNIHCSNNPARSWWDVKHYELQVDFTDAVTGKIYGRNTITAVVSKTPFKFLQIDLDIHLTITDARINNKQVATTAIGNATMLSLDTINSFQKLKVGDTFTISIGYEGRPQKAVMPPWDGGMVWATDSFKNPWMAVVCQSYGGALWYPCKNYQGDEPDWGVTEIYTVPNALTAIGNGRLKEKKMLTNLQATNYVWETTQPINNYNVTFYIGDYTYQSVARISKRGDLNITIYVLKEHEKRIQYLLNEAQRTLRCFEDKFGDYPFYEDGYKIVEAPYLGMEHQSAIAYGNKFRYGYLGKDLSGADEGLKWDFIVVHESAHEWFGNNITARDVADFWVHEGLATYAETIFTECISGKEAAFRYQRGKRAAVINDRAVQGHFNQCEEQSRDAYDKAGFMIHQIRLIMENDAQFFSMLKEMNKIFYHQTVEGKEIEQFINQYSGRNFQKIFDQYLRRAQLPTLVFEQKEDTIYYYWTNCVEGFDMPVLWNKGNKKDSWLKPNTHKQILQEPFLISSVQISKDFLINVSWR